MRSEPVKLLAPKHDDNTRTRLLHAAAEVFAEHGYEAATIRQICTQAKANVALVNYHFGDKLELYTEVLRYSMGARSGSPSPVASNPTEALKQIIIAMVDRGLETGDQTNLRYRLMLNEFMRPSEATARVVDVVLRPVYDRLREIIGAILELPPDDEKTRLCVHSILGQVSHFAHSRHSLALLWPQMDLSPLRRQRFAEHITQFTLAYLKPQPASRAKRR